MTIDRNNGSKELRKGAKFQGDSFAYDFNL